MPIDLSVLQADLRAMIADLPGELIGNWAGVIQCHFDDLSAEIMLEENIAPQNIRVAATAVLADFPAGQPQAETRCKARLAGGNLRNYFIERLSYSPDGNAVILTLREDETISQR